MIKTQNVHFVDVHDWDALVRETYGKPYNLQQQDGCKQRGVQHLSVTGEDPGDFFEEVTVLPEKVNHPDMGVNFKTWLARDPKQPLLYYDDFNDEQWAIDLWWERNFYPDTEYLAYDLHKRGLLPAGEYVINIDW